ncbi:hypothetical protein BMS3Bbin11_01614 [bacterium BMS3Bbin11]|nr:hypothetical protein BMS3Abin11_01071 [bacterium BMS3Abin11]GBE46513.1 hypothetical protein BMS3Bbin11_01614 [bacterium BMS3Bbin11]GMT40185.1 MAG: hypothetical protein IEMM0001_0920 [bacterium]
MNTRLPLKGVVLKFILLIRAVFLVMLLSTTLISGAPLALADGISNMQMPNEVASLKDLLATVNKTHQGKILEVEMEQDDINGKKIWVYEVKLLTRSGKVYELVYDAITLDLVKTEN